MAAVHVGHQHRGIAARRLSPHLGNQLRRLPISDAVVLQPGGAKQRRIGGRADILIRSEEHTSELQSLMRISYAVFCLKKKTKSVQKTITLIYNSRDSLQNNRHETRTKNRR